MEPSHSAADLFGRNTARVLTMAARAGLDWALRMAPRASIKVLNAACEGMASSDL